MLSVYPHSEHYYDIFIMMIYLYQNVYFMMMVRQDLILLTPKKNCFFSTKYIQLLDIVETLFSPTKLTLENNTIKLKNKFQKYFIMLK